MSKQQIAYAHITVREKNIIRIVWPEFLTCNFIPSLINPLVFCSILRIATQDIILPSFQSDHLF